MELNQAYAAIANSKCNLNHFGVAIGTGKRILHVCYSESIPLSFIGQGVKALTDEECICPWNAREAIFNSRGSCYKSEFDEARRRQKLIEKGEEK